MRTGLYVDGFNLYHAIDDLKKPYLKWLSLRRLARIASVGHARSIEQISFGTAYFPGDFGKKKRHEAYIQALKSEEVEVIFGHTTQEPQACNLCGARWSQPREKETDINVALAMYRACVAGKVDMVMLATADTDQAATLRAIRCDFPNIKLVVLTPPGREKSKHLRDLSDINIQITEDMLDASVFPAMLFDASGKLVRRPVEYAPPPGWVHWDDRPKKP
ncbi:NYN domain-containing protein [uncultured Paracoccus sp.]|uniref:NYN domain-containing protein n=1 Tax=uncultured Paracoccus sp. TaxID=189685 RepID=UPI002605F6AE|nr:NYN domain-containing protein [uncultured Paracoccus sp.]